MPAALLSRDEVVERLMSVIRRTGYDGASLSELSKATGLGKSSLYHHFPNGKDDMVRAVLDHLAAQLESDLFAPMRGPGTPKHRLDAMVRGVDAFYRHGNEACVLAQLVLGATHDRFRAPLRRIFTAWTDAIAGVLIDGGVPRRTAGERAQDAVLRIEGALIVSGGLGDTSVFARTLRGLASSLLAA
jgi:TetR/AcrR family transcriptional repressor of lmrAB and yxaGH operons